MVILLLTTGRGGWRKGPPVVGGLVSCHVVPSRPPERAALLWPHVKGLCQWKHAFGVFGLPEKWSGGVVRVVVQRIASSQLDLLG